ncbi:Uncharacterised protein [Vibrio cholerae]|nr:Uncharacterised protein [Vibrio cholerae]
MKCSDLLLAIFVTTITAIIAWVCVVEAINHHKINIGISIGKGLFGLGFCCLFRFQQHQAAAVSGRG